MRNQKKLLLEQLDKRLKPFKGTEKVAVPSIGWVKNIRTALNMTLSQLGKKLNITKQGARDLEKREESGVISIQLLREVGRVLEMDFVYGFVPIDGSVDQLVEKKAKKMATKIVLRTSQSMKLENQGNSDERIKQAIEELTEDLKNELQKSLWD